MENEAGRNVIFQTSQTIERHSSGGALTLIWKFCFIFPSLFTKFSFTRTLKSSQILLVMSGKRPHWSRRIYVNCNRIISVSVNVLDFLQKLGLSSLGALARWHSKHLSYLLLCSMGCCPRYVVYQWKFICGAMSTIPQQELNPNTCFEYHQTHCHDHRHKNMWANKTEPC